MKSNLHSMNIAKKCWQEYDKGPLYLLLALLLFKAIGDYNASSYGKGIYFDSKNLKYGISLTYITELCFTSDEHWSKGEVYLSKKMNYMHKFEDTIVFYNIYNLLGYYISKDSLHIVVNSDKGDVVFSYTNKESVYNYNPIVSKFKQTQNHNWTNFEDEFFLIRYWKIIFVGISFFEFLIIAYILFTSVVLAIRCFKNI